MLVRSWRKKVTNGLCNTVYNDNFILKRYASTGLDLFAETIGLPN